MAYKSDPRGRAPVRLAAVHTAEGARTAASLGSYFYNPAVQASSHVGIDASATLQYVGYDRSAWTIRSGNPVSDNAELCGFAHWTRAQWLSTATADGCANPRAMLDRTAAWIRSRCLARGIPIRKITPAQVAAGQSGVIAHWDWTLGMHDGTHTDPGSGFPWDYVIAKANETAEDWFSMATPKEIADAVETGVFNALSRFVQSNEVRWDKHPDGSGGSNWADCVVATRNAAVGLQEQTDTTHEKLDALISAVEATAPQSK